MENNIYKQIGASNHTDKERAELDYYATEPAAAQLLEEIIPLHKNIWECAAGGKHLSQVFEANGHIVRNTDIIDRTGDIEELDFLSTNEKWDGDIITNPPYNLSTEFCEKAIETVTEGNYVCMFLKIQFLEGKKHRKLFDKYPPKYVYVSTKRLNCAANGDFEKYKYNSAVAYAWYVWKKGYKGDTILKWFN